MPFNILHREVAGGAGFLRDYCATESVVRRFELSQTLKGHYGCVNTVNWNSVGSLLVSGSDDTRLCIYDYDKGLKLQHRIDTGHSANIFSAKFMPYQDERIACCAGDDEVRTFHNFELDQVYTCHQARVKKIATHMQTPSTFLSASEDGTVRHFDVRIRGSEQGDHILLAVGSHYGNYNLEVYSLAYDPTCSNYFILGGGDPYVRLYDMRVLNAGQRTENTNTKDKRCVKAFCPNRVKGRRDNSSMFMQGHITGVAYSYDGREALATYSGDGVYLFDIRENEDMRTRVMREGNIDENKNSTSKMDDSNDEENEEKEQDEEDKEIEKKRKGKKKQEENEEEKEKEEEEEQNIAGNTYSQRYEGHRNVRTVKEVNFYGPHSEYVVSGSDCGRIFMWDKKTAKLVNMMKGDKDVVNCTTGHPFDAVLATSGIDSNVKIWLPTAEKLREITKQDEDVMQENNSSTASRRMLPDIYAILRAFTRREAFQRGDIGEDDDDDNDDDLEGEDEEHEEGEGQGDAEEGGAEGEGEGGEGGEQGERAEGEREGEGERRPRRFRWRRGPAANEDEEGEEDDGRVRCEYQ